MTTEQETTDGGDTGGLDGIMDRFDTMFDEDGAPKEGTDEVYGDDTEPKAAESDATEETPEITTDESDSENPVSDDEVQNEEKDADSVADDTETDKTKDTDDYDKETLEIAKDLHLAPPSEQGRAFKNLRDKLKTEVAARDQRILELEQGISASAEYESLKIKAERAEKLNEELTQAQQRLHLLDYKTTPDYKSQVDVPRQSIFELAAVIEKNNSIEPGVVTRALQMTDTNQQSDAISAIATEYGLNDIEKQRLLISVDDLIKIDAVESNLTTQAEVRLKELTQSQISEQSFAQEKAERELTQTINSTFEKFEGRIPGFITADGLPNNAWEELKATSLDSSITTVSDQAHAIFCANALPTVLDSYKELAAQLKEKNVLLSRYTKAKPTQDLASTTTAKAKDDNASFLDRLNSMDF